MPISFGSDPEFMLMKDGRYFSAIGIVEGDIANRIKENGHEFYWDNVLAECAIKPGFNREEVVENFRDCFKTYARIVAPYRLVPQASQHYPAAELDNEKARNAGCAPDNCAYLVKRIKPPKGFLANTDLRTCGGHVHLGRTDDSQEALDHDSWLSIITVRLLDLFVGVPSLYIDHDPTSLERRVLYGKAGRFRPKPYGLEYRSLSNFWLASPTLVELIYDLCQFTVDFVNDGKWSKFYKFNEELYWEVEAGQLKRAYKCTAYKEDELRACLDKKSVLVALAAEDFLSIVYDNVPKDLYERIKKAMTPTTCDFYKEWGIE